MKGVSAPNDIEFIPIKQTLLISYKVFVSKGRVSARTIIR
tara:strand:- start:393 stop:512 length:120 start_codon:yes stop_codon:yes gene_type:complete